MTTQKYTPQQLTQIARNLFITERLRLADSGESVCLPPGVTLDNIQECCSIRLVEASSRVDLIVPIERLDVWSAEWVSDILALELSGSLSA